MKLSKVKYLRSCYRNRCVIQTALFFCLTSSHAWCALSHVNPEIVYAITESASVQPLADESYTILSDDYTGLTDRYLAGVGVSGNIDVLSEGVFLTDSQSFTIKNTVNNSGAIGIGLGAAHVGEIAADFVVEAQTEARGLGLSGEVFNPSGQKSILEAFTGSLTVSSFEGDAVGIDLEYGEIKSLSNASITVKAQSSSARSAGAVGITVAAGGNIGSMDKVSIDVSTQSTSEQLNSSDIDGISIASGATVGIDADGGKQTLNMDITVSSQNGSASFISLAETSDIGTVQGTFIMNTLNDASQASDYSVGYLLGDSVFTTTASIGFSKNQGEGRSSSQGIDVDWDNTRMTIHRNYGLSAGVVAMGLGGAMNGTVLGSTSLVEATVNHGLAGAFWATGTILSEGAVEGILRATAQNGSAIGLGTAGTDLVMPDIVNQSTDPSILGNIAGTIEATVVNESAGSIAVGVQLANIYPELEGNQWAGYNPTGVILRSDTKVEGYFSGDIIVKVENMDTTLDAAARLENGNLVAGIVDMGTQTLKFDGATNTATNAAGTSIDVRMNKTIGETSQQLAYGEAIITLEGDLRVSNTGTTSATTAQLAGNLTAGVTTGGAVKKIVFEKGHFSVESQAWNSGGGVDFGQKSPDTGVGSYEIARVNLQDLMLSDSSASTTINASTLSFYSNSESIGDSSLLYLEAGARLELEGLSEVNVYLQGSEADYTGRLYFVDARNGEYFDAENISLDDYNIFFEGQVDEHVQHENFRLVHDETGIYLHIPEPSTATLSLLALGGLLTRRRRRS